MTKAMSTSKSPLSPSSSTTKRAVPAEKNDGLPRIEDMKSLAEYILHPKCRSICTLTGAGVSVASGIPDFRSPGGLYDTLRPELLTATPEQRHILRQDPMHVVSWKLFRDNPLPYMEVRRPFILGTQAKQWKPTIAHRFAELLHTKTTNTVTTKKNNQTTTSTQNAACGSNSSSSSSKLTRVYTPNIDGLDHLCDDIPSSKIVNVHGRISNVACEGCKATMDFDEFCDKVRTQIKDIYDSSPGPKAEPTSTTTKTSTEILCPSCGQGLVKPTTVMFGRNVPSEFFERLEDDMPTTDLLIVAGTSLVVSPANSLVNLVPKSTPRVVFNLQPVGKHLGLKSSNSKKDPSDLDFYKEGECDALFLELIEELGWMEDLVSTIEVLPPKSQKLVRERMNAKHESI
mmetsp:Transcript_1469/g.3260  ORF Transcript_1469/g.3260 Transcript_1469/m.3260 type:complete len:400 (+) Transcript_1469:164-1363(+)